MLVVCFRVLVISFRMLLFFVFANLLPIPLTKKFIDQQLTLVFA